MSSLNSGDRIRITATDYDVTEDPNLANGQTGTFIGVVAPVCMVRTDNGPRRVDPEGEGWAFFFTQVERIDGGAA